MNMKIRRLLFVLILLILFIVVSQGDIGSAQHIYYEKAIYTSEYGLSFYPGYPAKIGETITLRLRTFSPALKVTLYSDREEKIPMTYRQGHWWGRFKIPEDYKEGGHFFTVWIKYLKFDPRGLKPQWSKSTVWYKAFVRAEPALTFPPEFMLAEEARPLPPVTGEAIEIKVVSPEVTPLKIKGSQSITFRTRSLEGSREGYTPGTQQTREETLRVNVSGKAAGTDIDATFYRTSATGVSYAGEQEEKISVRLRQGSTEAYLGDFTADLTETEFTRLNKVLSGARVKGDYEKWGFTALYSSPRGESKFTRRYGDGSQGPYQLEYSPVVIDSERVTVDGISQKRGDDYTIDYQAGSITFLRKVIDAKSVIRIDYDYRQTVYQHATYGLRAYVRPSPNLKIGATYLDDSDSLAGAEEIRGSMSEEAFDPQSHQVLGVDGSLVSENLLAAGELAVSSRNLNLLSPTPAREGGGAAKFGFSTSQGAFGLSGHFKRISEKFRPIAEPDPKQDVWEYGGGLSYRPSSLFGSQGNYGYQKYRQGGVLYENLYKTAKAKVTPERLPSLEYIFSETDESNDPVTGDSIRRVITRNSVETIHEMGFVSSSIKGSLEKWLRRSPSEEVTDYRKVNFGLASMGIEKFSFSSNVELENRQEPDGREPYRRTYDLNLSATPAKEYFLSSSLQIVDDSEEGHSNVADISYRAQPTKIFKTDGKYTITSVQEEFPTTAEAVSKQSGSFSFNFRPFRYLRLRYLYKPNFTQILRTDTRSYNNLLQQGEINLVPVKQVMLGLVMKQGNSFSVDKDDYPDYQRKEKSQDSDSTLYTLKLAPFKILSTEFNYLQDSSLSKTLASTQEPYSYEKGRSATRRFDAIAKTSLSEKFSVDTRYTYDKTDEGTGEVGSNLTDTKTHTASLKGIWNYSKNWTFSVSGAYGRTTDYILTQVTYTITPGFGFIYRLGDRLRVDFDYTHSKSYAGEETEKDNLSLKTKYAVSEFVDFTLQAKQEISRSPDYRLTDITGNLEISL
jgi:hypothetical protein